MTAENGEQPHKEKETTNDNSRASTEASGPFLSWLRELSLIYPAVTAAVVLVLGAIVPERLLPEPIADVRWFASVLALLAFALTWAWRRQVRKYIKSITVCSVVIATLLLAMNLLFVRTVTFTSPVETRHYLVGFHIADPDFQGLPDEEIVRMAGSEYGDLRQVWGMSFVVVSLGYAIGYSLLALGTVLAFGGSTLGSKDRRKI